MRVNYTKRIKAGIAQLVERNLAKVEKASLYQVFLFSQLPIETQ